MDIKQFKASLQLAELRAKSDPSEANLALLEKAKTDYEDALDPEKKMPEEDGQQQTTSALPAQPGSGQPKPSGLKPKPASQASKPAEKKPTVKQLAAQVAQQIKESKDIPPVDPEQPGESVLSPQGEPPHPPLNPQE